MPDPTAFLAAVDRLADRFRALPQSRLDGSVPGYPSRAAAALALARGLAAQAQAAEQGAQDPGARLLLRELPDAGPFAAGDQVAVAGHDLAAALAALPDAAPVPVPVPSTERTAAAEDVLAAALASVEAVTDLCLR